MTSLFETTWQREQKQSFAKADASFEDALQLNAGQLAAREQDIREKLIQPGHLIGHDRTAATRLLADIVALQAARRDGTGMYQDVGDRSTALGVTSASTESSSTALEMAVANEADVHMTQVAQQARADGDIAYAERVEGAVIDTRRKNQAAVDHALAFIPPPLPESKTPPIPKPETREQYNQRIRGVTPAP